ncbi:MAG: ATP-binding protein [Tissierellia bacterium]|nr:ATP-binding protein [Tissierellia bacterium]
MYKVDKRIPSCLEEVKKNIKQVLKDLDEIIDDDELLFNIRLILNELVINGVEHGNCFDKTKYIDFSICLNENEIIIKVKDQGGGIKYSKSSYNPQCLKNCGRGLFIVKALSKELMIEDNEVIAKLSV